MTVPVALSAPRSSALGVQPRTIRTRSTIRWRAYVPPGHGRRQNACATIKLRSGKGAGALPTQSNIERSLGIVIGKLDGIEDRLNRQDESRAALHRRVDDLVLRQTHQEADIVSIKNKVDGMEKVTVAVTTLRTKAQGAGALGHWLIRIGIGVVSVAGWIYGAYLWVTGRPPP